MEPTRAYFAITATIFLFVAIAHLSRVVGKWDAVIAGGTVPQWISIPGLIVPAALAAWGYTLASRARRTP